MGESMRLILFVVILITQFHAQAIIFGNDDRHDVIQSARASRLGRSVALMAADVFVLPQATPKDTFKLDFVLGTDSTNIGLCKEEKFSSQYTGWINCTGFLVAEDIIVTAGHCMTFKMQALDNTQQIPMCNTFKWVFDFKADSLNPAGQIENVPAENVYTCKKIIRAEHLAFMADQQGKFVPPQNGNHGTDFAIIQLDRKVTGNRPALKLATTEPKAGDQMMTIGYPLALPLKYANNAHVLETKYDHFFVTDLDIVGGNSGSPVFNFKDEVVGIAVRSFPYEDMTYHPERSCSTLNSCPKMGAGACVPEDASQIIGTHVDRIKHVQKWLTP